MVKKTVTKAEFSRTCGVSQAAVTKAIKEGRLLLVGKRIDLDCPLSIAYMSHHIDSDSNHIKDNEPVKPKDKPAVIPFKKYTRESKQPVDKPSNHNLDYEKIHAVPDNLEAYADYTLREIIAKYGTDQSFLDWLKATKLIEDIQEKRLKNSQTEGNLINRDLVQHHIIEPINTAHTKIMSDAARSIAVMAHALVKAGSDEQAIQDMVVDQFGSFIRPLKARLVRVIKNA